MNVDEINVDTSYVKWWLTGEQLAAYERIMSMAISAMREDDTDEKVDRRMAGVGSGEAGTAGGPALVTVSGQAP